MPSKQTSASHSAVSTVTATVVSSPTRHVSTDQMNESSNAALPARALQKNTSGAHTSYQEMIRDALIRLQSRNGSSRQAIKKFIRDNHDLGTTTDALFASRINRALAMGVKNNTFTQPRGPSGLVKLAKKPATKHATVATPKLLSEKVIQKVIPKPAKLVHPESGSAPKSQKPTVKSTASTGKTFNSNLTKGDSKKSAVKSTRAVPSKVVKPTASKQAVKPAPNVSKTASTLKKTTSTVPSSPKKTVKKA